MTTTGKALRSPRTLNNLLIGFIGGTVANGLIMIVNSVSIARLVHDRRCHAGEVVLQPWTLIDPNRPERGSGPGVATLDGPWPGRNYLAIR